jgi:hypothetical protein
VRRWTISAWPGDSNVEGPDTDPIEVVSARDVEPLIAAARMGLDMAERAHGNAPREGEDYYAHRDAIRAALQPFEEGER